MIEIKQAEIKPCKPGDPCPAGFVGKDATEMACYGTDECPIVIETGVCAGGEYYDRLMGEEKAMKFDPTSPDRPFDHCCQCTDYDDKCGTDPKCKRSVNEYFVFIVRRRYAFGETGDIEATVLIPQDIDTSIVEEIEAFLSDKHSDMWAGPFADEFSVTI